MSSIGKIKQPFYTTTQGKSGMIASIKMEIARITAQAQYGMIPQDQAKIEIAILEAKLSALESGLNVDGLTFEPPVAINKDAEIVNQPSESHNESPNDNNDSEQRQESFFEQQAMYNRMFHGI